MIKKNKFVIAAGLALLGLSAQAQNDANRYLPHGITRHPVQRCTSMEIVTQDGALPQYPFNGQTWVEGQANSEYKVTLTNACPFKTLAVVSVDGLNVLNGEKANYQQTGYVIEPNSSVSISGWRKNRNETAAFYFTYPENSYASRVSKAGNIGVIGVAFFREKEAVYVDRNYYGREEDRMNSTRGATPMPPPAPPGASPRAAESSAQDKSLGTGYGRNINSPTRSVEFERMDAPFNIQQVRYESRQKLVSMGVIPRFVQPREPQAFPDQQQFVPPPPSYR